MTALQGIHLPYGCSGLHADKKSRHTRGYGCRHEAKTKTLKLFCTSTYLVHAIATHTTTTASLHKLQHVLLSDYSSPRVNGDFHAADLLIDVFHELDNEIDELVLP